MTDNENRKQDPIPPQTIRQRYPSAEPVAEPPKWVKAFWAVLGLIVGVGFVLPLVLKGVVVTWAWIFGF